MTMLKRESVPQMSVEDLIQESLRRENDLLKFYHEILPGVGYESLSLMTSLCEQQEARIAQLRNLLSEIQELRELTGSIAD